MWCFKSLLLTYLISLSYYKETANVGFSDWQVAGAKVVTNARSPMSKCYGFVTMGTAEEASKCIQHLHRTELHGKMISVERVWRSVITCAMCTKLFNSVLILVSSMSSLCRSVALTGQG